MTYVVAGEAATRRRTKGCQISAASAAVPPFPVITPSNYIVR